MSRVKIVTPKRKNPLGVATSKGAFCAFRPAKASPFGRGVTEGDGEGKPGRKEPLRSDRQALCRSDTIAVQSCLAASLPSQSGLRPPAPPKGEPLACRSAFVWTLKARSFAPYRASGVQWKVTRPAKASPTRGNGDDRRLRHIGNAPVHWHEETFSSGGILLSDENATVFLISSDLQPVAPTQTATLNAICFFFDRIKIFQASIPQAERISYAVLFHALPV